MKYRQQIIFNNKKLQIINDSKSTSFASSLNLLQSYKNIYWIVGGKFKKGDKFILNNGKPKFIERITQLDTRRLDKGSHWPI